MKKIKITKAAVKQIAREWIEAIIQAFVLVWLIFTFIVQPFKIPTGSMRPTLLEGDRIFVNKFIYGAKIPFTNFRLPALRQPRRADIVVFIYPNDRKIDYIKRLTGFSGETIEIKNGKILVNGKETEEEIFKQIYYFNRGDFAQDGQKIAVPQDCYFVLGDNSFSSKDSRYWGFVPKSNILGKAFMIYWPIRRIRILN